MHKFEHTAPKNPEKILEEFAQQQRESCEAWEADWSRRVNELAERSGQVMDAASDRSCIANNLLCQ